MKRSSNVQNVTKAFHQIIEGGCCKASHPAPPTCVLNRVNDLLVSQSHTFLNLEGVQYTLFHFNYVKRINILLSIIINKNNNNSKFNYLQVIFSPETGKLLYSNTIFIAIAPCCRQIEKTIYNIDSEKCWFALNLGCKFTYSFVPNCRVGSNEMHQGENYQGFLKWGGWGGVLLGRSLIIIK